VVQLWQHLVLRQRHLADSENKAVEVIYPGRLNDSRGGDFKEAVVISGNQRSCGFIEIHTTTSHWKTHGHQRDPIYNGVVLHVALHQDSFERTVLQNGQIIPTVILAQNSPTANTQLSSESGLPCQFPGRRTRTRKLMSCLEEAGIARFEAKAGRYQEDLRCLDAGQVLYQGLAEALGYSKNQIPFRELSQRVSIKVLERAVQNSEENIEGGLIRQQALLLGAAGLLPTQRGLIITDDEFLGKLEQVWYSLKYPAVLGCHDWEIFRVRPSNSPVRRIVALSHLLNRFHQIGWPQALLNLVRTVPVTDTPRELELALIVKSEDYWTCHSDFGVFSPRPQPILLGQVRAAEIVLNVLLPFALSWSRVNSEPVLSRKVRQLYACYHRLAENSIERHMLRQLQLTPLQINTACLQQGLIHVYKTCCTRGKCGECLLNRKNKPPR
jgi:hypothetical protein